MGPTRPPGTGGAPDALDPARGRLLHLIVARPAASPPTVADLAGAVGGHPNTTRYHLRALLDAGLVEVERGLPAGTRGRPATRYAATQAGRERDETTRHTGAARDYVPLAAAVAGRLVARGGDPRPDAREIGRAWGASLLAGAGGGDGGALGDRDVVGDGEVPADGEVLADGEVPADGDVLVDDGGARGDVGVIGTAGALSDPAGARASAAEQVIALLARLGFAPETEARASRGPALGSGSRLTVLLRTCPLLDAARRHPHVVCEVHLGLVAGALEALGEPSERVRLVPFARPGACVLDLPSARVG